MKTVRTKTSVIHLGDCLEVLPALPENSVHVCVTSPPYFGLRDYKTGRWRGGDSDCVHTTSLPRGGRGGSGAMDKRTVGAFPEGIADKVCKKCGAVREDRQIGMEASPAEFVRAMVEVFRGVKRVLRDDGTLWLNLGDSFAGSGKGGNPEGSAWSGYVGRVGKEDASKVGKGKFVPEGTKEKELMGIPWKVAEALKADGWILRGEIIWHKLSGMPENLSGWRWEKCRKKVRRGHTNGYGRNKGKEAGGWDKDSHPETRIQPEYEDCPGCKKCEKNGGLVLRRGSWRPTNAHEVIFLFAKTPTYFCDADAVRTPLAAATVVRDRYSRVLDDPDEQFAVKHDHETVSNQAGANLRDVVTFKRESLKERHYATFPSGLPKLAIRAGTSQRGVCPTCGAPWCRVVDRKRVYHHTTSADGKSKSGPYSGQTGAGSGTHDVRHGVMNDVKTLGWRPTCGCPEHDPVPATVLDPFMGSGTSSVAAAKLGRHSVGVELNPEFLKIAEKRVLGAEKGRGFGLER